MNEKTLASLIEIKKSFKILEQVKRSNNPLIHALNSMVAVIKDTSKKLFFFKFPNEDFDASVCFFNFFFYWAFLKKHTPLLEWKISLLEKSWKNKRTSGTNIFKQSKSLREKCLYSGPHFPIFGLKVFIVEISVFIQNTEKYKPEKSTYLDTLHRVRQ